jgi:transposase-like protein
LYLDRVGKTHDLALRPTDLLTTLWLQFAMAVVENKEFRKCESCSRSFELSPEINRMSRYYCSNACRVKAYRGRKAKALRLSKSGKTIGQIAEVLESDEATVKKWLNVGVERKKGPKR